MHLSPPPYIALLHGSFRRLIPASSRRLAISFIRQYRTSLIPPGLLSCISTSSCPDLSASSQPMAKRSIGVCMLIVLLAAARFRSASSRSIGQLSPAAVLKERSFGEVMEELRTLILKLSNRLVTRDGSSQAFLDIFDELTTGNRRGKEAGMMQDLTRSFMHSFWVVDSLIKHSANHP